MITRRQALQGLAAGALGCARPSNPRPTSSSPPNVLYVFVDQLRAQALSIFGEINIVTPRLDRLASEGVSFCSAYANQPVCGPARATLLTGAYAARYGVFENGMQLQLDAPTLSQRLADQGYATGFIGKWHLDGHEHGSGYVPPANRHGFQEWAAYEFGHRYLESSYWRDANEELHPVPADTYEPEYQTDQALDFIQRNTDTPWLLMIGYAPPHPPGMALVPWSRGIPQQWLDQVDPDAISFRGNVPDWIQDDSLLPNGGLRAYLHGYYAAIMSMDAIIGRLLDGLTASGQAQDTLVVFTSDHGDMAGSHGLIKKSWPFEEAARVPLMLRWPGEILADQRIFTPCAHIDLVPTIYDLLGLDPEPSADGHSLASWARGGSDQPHDVYLYGRLSRPAIWDALRSERYKLSLGLDEAPTLLYDLDADPLERDNLAEKPAHQDLRHELTGRIEAQRDDIFGSLG